MLEKISRPVMPSEVSDLLLAHYGLQGELDAITGERDHNYRLTQNGKAKFIVKVAHEDEAFETLEFQSSVIKQIQHNAPHIPVSREIPNLHGDHITGVEFKDGQRRFMRVNAFMPGTALCDVARTPETRRAIGGLTASLALALYGFRHTADQRVLLWDIQQAAALSPHVQSLPLQIRRTAEGFHNHFIEVIAPLAGQLRHGVIHNDLNLHNLFVNAGDHGQITGCIDFGDMVRAPLVNDLAIATAYQMDVKCPLQSILEVAQGYHALHPLLPLEIDQLFNLVAMRFVLTVAITHWRSKLHPENAIYILRNAPAAEAGLQALFEISSATAREFLYDHLKPKADATP